MAWLREMVKTRVLKMLLLRPQGEMGSMLPETRGKVTSLERKPQWCSGGTFIWGVTSISLIGLNAHCIVRNAHLVP